VADATLRGHEHRIFVEASLRWPASAADGILCGFHRFQRLLDCVFHHGHATPYGGLDQFDLLHDEYIDFAPRTLMLLFGLAKEVFTSLPGLEQNPILGDQPLGLTLGALDDASGFVLRLADDTLSFLDDALCLLDFIWNGLSQLIDKCEEFLLLDHDPGTEGNPLAYSDKFFQPIDKIQNVCGSIRLNVLPAAVIHLLTPRSCC